MAPIKSLQKKEQDSFMNNLSDDSYNDLVPIKLAGGGGYQPELNMSY